MADHVHESWWLVEGTYAPVPLYYAGHRKGGKAPHMIAEASRAVRFPDHDSALYTICHLLGIPVGMGAMLAHRGYVVREHIFDYTPAAAVSPDTMPADTKRGES